MAAVTAKKNKALLRSAALVAALAIIAAAGAVYFARRAKKLQLRESAMSQQAALCTLAVGGVQLQPTGGSVQFADSLGEDALVFSAAPQSVAVSSFSQAALQPQSPLAGEAEVTVTQNGEQLFAANAREFAAAFLPRNGSYELAVSLPVAGEVQQQGYSAAVRGEVQYHFTLNYDVTPQFSLSADSLMQGDAIVLRAFDVPADAELFADTGGVMDYMNFSPLGGGAWQAILGVSYRCAPGQYSCAVALDGQTVQTLNFTVTEQTYTEQHLTISTATKSATVDNSDAQQQYNNMIAQTMYHWTEDIYFDGPFLHPLAGGTVTTEFGLFRYTNGSKTASRHVGVDIAAAKGSDIIAPAAGEVLVAEYLTTTGWTICLEHGMGVHTYYYHMDSVAVQAGDFVAAGSVIGAVGETGYATGPHLHYNVMVGENSVDPWATMDGSSGIFALLQTP
ncbi:MAG: M23 family metallopeptidase [Oscillospiraceae bacterium]|nr:M23 family metallopeptidase [Oscillospiraceae bacterium]